MNFTPEQAEAIFNHGQNLIVTAGAGSGKTRVLVERFIALLDRHPDWPLTSIVAITFTEKAAREMRDRVRQAIERRLADAPDDAERDRWFQHAAALNGARIGTIHSLCAQLLRANPAEAALDPAFEVLDENEAAIARVDAVESALARLATGDSPATALLSEYDMRTVRAILYDYASPSRAAEVAEALADGPGALWARWERAWVDERAAIIRALRADPAWQDALAWGLSQTMPEGDKLTLIWEDVLAAAPALLQGDDDSFYAAAVPLAQNIKWTVGSKANWLGEERLQTAKDHLKTIRGLLRAALDEIGPPPGELDALALDWLVCWGEAIALVAEEYARLKERRGALDFDDLEHRARLLLQNDTVCARYHAEFRQILVDEFQDTNDAQREIIYRLCAADRPEGAGRLFVVGDPKQSIYAFRGADVSVFGKVRDDLLARAGRELPLSTSFRTHERLVAAFNDIFGALLTVGEGPAARYEVSLGKPMAAHRACDLTVAPHQDAPITVLAIPRLDEASGAEKLDKEALRRWEAWELAQTISALVDGGANVWDRELNGGCYRPARYGDVAVLFRAVKHMPLVEDVFKAAGLPYVTISGRGYFDRQEVWDLRNLLRALHNPADDLALAGVLRSPLFGLSDEALLALRLPVDGNGPLPLWKALFADDPPGFPADEVGALDFAREVLFELRDRAGRVPIAELLARALHRTGYLAVLSGLSDGARRRGNVEKFVGLARASGRIGLGEFDAYVRDLSDREAREGEATVEVENAIRLMTVHASKGLEFPIVALFDTTWTRNERGAVFSYDPDTGPVCTPPLEPTDDRDKPKLFAVEWAKKLSARREQAEHRRLLYVAATRAADYLILSGTPDTRLKKSYSSDDCWLSLWLRALGVDPDALAPGEWEVRRAWGACVIRVPQTPPDFAAMLPRSTGAALGWEHPALAAGQPVEGVGEALPPLLAEVPTEPDAPARTLSATQIAKLGRIAFTDPQKLGRRAFRHAVLHDAPDALRPLPDGTPDSGIVKRTIGETVHRALRAWLLPDVTDPALLDERLQAYVWELGVTDPVLAGQVVEQARRLLAKFARSDIRRELDSAKQVYHELPFVYHHSGTRAIYGVIDTLYFDGKHWHILDYKTALVSWNGAKENARRYYLQLGVYAAAVYQQVEQVPETVLYYIHPGRAIRIQQQDWQPALDRLDEDVRAALQMEPDD